MKIKSRVWNGTKFWHDVAIYDNSPYVWNYEETSLVPLFSQEHLNHCYNNNSYELKVIGNIFDNSSLLNEN
jgi:hypothetical protein